MEIAGIDTGLLIAACAFMALDVLTGIAKGAASGSLDSTAMRRGMWHKAGFAGLMALSVALQAAQAMADLGIEVPTVTAVCAFVVMTEAVSIIENLCEINPDIADSPIGRLFGAGGEKKSEDSNGLE